MDDDEDEELLLLRIKALKSTPRVNISVEFTSDSDNDLTVIKKKKQYERKHKNCDDAKSHRQESSPDIGDNEDEEERKLREIALSSLRRSTSQKSSKKLIVESKEKKQSTTIHISQDVTAVVKDPGSCQHRSITSSESTESKLQESSAIQHDLISSTSGDNTTHVTPKCHSEPVVKTLCSRSTTVDFAIERPKSNDCNGISDIAIERPKSNDCNGTSDSNIIEEKSDRKDAHLEASEKDVGKKLPSTNGDIDKNTTTLEKDLASISKDNEQGTIDSTEESPPFSLNEEFIPPEFANYSPSSPSETEAEVEEEQNGLCDDVLSLCTSDKDENELVGLFPENDLQVTATNSNLPSSKSLACEHKLKSPDTANEKSVSDNEINSSCPDDEDPVSTNANGLNIILDRYLNEVAASKNIKKINVCSEDEQGIVKNCTSGETASHDMGDCKPGPSGYVKPTIIHGYDSESEDSLVDTTPILKNKTCEKGLLTGVKTRVDGEEKDNSSDASIKCVLEEKGHHEEEDEQVKDATCSVCLGPFENRAFLNFCFHSFCYMCIMQWSEISRLCPLCKSKYTSLIHSVNTDLDYETYEFPDDLPKTERDDVPYQREFSETMDDGRRFRYRSTVIDHEEWERRKTDRERMEQEYLRSRQQRRIKRRLKWSATKDIRKSVYQKGLQLKEVKQKGNPKYRDISPEFFTANPALKHRLVPWLLRDLNVLLGNDDENIRFLMSLILKLLSKLCMREAPFREQLRPFLFEHTDRFVNELVSFASSPYDIRGYDSNASYSKPENDVEIVSTSKPAIQISDNECSGEKKELNILHEVFLADEEGAGPLAVFLVDEERPLCDDGIEDICVDTPTKCDSSLVSPMKTNGYDNISPADTDGDEVVEEEVVDVSIIVADKEEDGVLDGTKTDDQSESEDSHSERPKRRKKDDKKKKKRKRKRKRLDAEKVHRKKKRSKKESAKKKNGKVGHINGTLSDDDTSAAFLRKDENELTNVEKDDPVEDEHETKGENTKSDAPLTQNNNSDKKEKSEKESDSKRKRNVEEMRRKRKKHKKKYKHVKRDKRTKHEKHLKHVKRKRRRISSSSEEDDEDNKEDKVSKKSKKNNTETASSSKKTDTEESDIPPHKRKPNKKCAAAGEKEEKSSKKSLKRKRDSSGTDRLPKRKKKEKNKNTPDVKDKRKKKERKKKKKEKHRKNGGVTKASHEPGETETGVNTGGGQEADKELRSKIDHAIKSIMVTKRGTNSSDEEDEFLNSQEVQDLLTKYKYDKLDLIKDGDGYKTRAEVVHELLLIEKAITRRKEKKQKLKQKTDTSKCVLSNGNTESPASDGLEKKQDGESLTDKAMKKAEREKSYKVLIQELQEIEGRINSCRSSLQAKPTGLIQP